MAIKRRPSNDSTPRKKFLVWRFITCSLLAAFRFWLKEPNNRRNAQHGAVANIKVAAHALRPLFGFSWPTSATVFSSEIAFRLLRRAHLAPRSLGSTLIALGSRNMLKSTLLDGFAPAQP